MEHFDEERMDEQRLRRSLLIRWLLGFGALFLFVATAFWWSGSAVRYGAARVGGVGVATYEVKGMIVDSKSHQPVPWASITTEINFGPQFFETYANADGSFSLMTMAEPHRLIVKANGYQDGRVAVGKQWFSWLPHGAEEKDIELVPR